MMKALNTILLISGLFLLTGFPALQAQSGMPEKPPRPMSVSVQQHLNFGTFSAGTGGSVTIDSWGARFVTGVIAIGSMTYCPAVFQVDAEPGTLIRWIGSDAVLSNGTGGTMDLHVDNSLYSHILSVSNTGEIRVSIGGTLTVGATTPPGNYTGEFSITFIQE